MEQNLEGLSKKERKLLLRSEKEQQIKQEKSKQKWASYIVGSILTGILLAGGWYIFKELSAPLPGTQVTQLGRTHVSLETKVQYNSNPPTSGDHYADWIKTGIYSDALDDRRLVHSLEHGYIIVSYNCMKLNSKFKVQNLKLIGTAFAHDDSLESSPSAGSGSSEELKGNVWEGPECKDLVKKLSDTATEVRMWKIIVIPRPILDTPIALTAWGRIETLKSFDKERIMRFITAFRDRGPEKTME